MFEKLTTENVTYIIITGIIGAVLLLWKPLFYLHTLITGKIEDKIMKMVDEKIKTEVDKIHQDVKDSEDRIRNAIETIPNKINDSFEQKFTHVLENGMLRFSNEMKDFFDAKYVAAEKEQHLLELAYEKRFATIESDIKIIKEEVKSK